MCRYNQNKKKNAIGKKKTSCLTIHPTSPWFYWNKHNKVKIKTCGTEINRYIYPCSDYICLIYCCQYECLEKLKEKKEENKKNINSI